MKRFALVVTGFVAACAFATPTLAGNNSNNQDGFYYRWEPRNHGSLGVNRAHQGRNDEGRGRYGMTEAEYRALQLRKECQMYAFGPWRFHPDYQHCGYN